MNPPLSRPLLTATLALALAAVAAADDAPAEPPRTIITSDSAEARNDGVEAWFVFVGNVHLTGNNLDVTCDKLEVWAETETARGDVGPIRRILATGRVVIRQEGRQATAGVVEVLPREDMVTLTEDPVVTDTAGTAAGERIRFFRGSQRLFIDKPRVEMRGLPNLGFPQQEPPAAPAPTAEDQPAPTP
jgi:lipopolysaccharide export system protein LptA